MGVVSTMTTIPMHALIGATTTGWAEHVRMFATADEAHHAADRATLEGGPASRLTWTVVAVDVPITLEILHGRDPDSSCELSPYVNGVGLDQGNFDVEDLDPGWGYELSDWEDHTEWVRTADYSPSFKAAVVANRDEVASYSQYIDKDR